MEAPAFVERADTNLSLTPDTGVSPGWKPRPSLSEHRAGDFGDVPPGVAGVEARPSLSDATAQLF